MYVQQNKLNKMDNFCFLYNYKSPYYIYILTIILDLFLK